MIRLAIHEAGHVIAGIILGRMEIVGVSIGDRGGLTEMAHIAASVDPDHCNDIIVMLMAGRAAEELVLGSPAAGAGGTPDSDLAYVTEIVKKIELKFGFGDFGPIYVAEDDLRDRRPPCRGFSPA